MLEACTASLLAAARDLPDGGSSLDASLLLVSQGFLAALLLRLIVRRIAAQAAADSIVSCIVVSVAAIMPLALLCTEVKCTLESWAAVPEERERT